MAQITTPRELLVHELQDLYSAETQLLAALPLMAEAATDEQLSGAFETHLEQTREHVARLQKIGEQLGESMGGVKCLAMEGLLAEGKETMEEDAMPALLDLALIGAAQKVEHYEIASYGTARALAERCDENDVADILQETLDEEGETDKLLTTIASDIDVESVAAMDEDEDEDAK